MSVSTLAGKTAIVTGAAEGIGAIVAARLAADGAAVVLADVPSSSLEREVSSLVETGADVRSRTFDPSDAASVRDCLNYTVSALGRLDIAVNATGMAESGWMLEQPVADFDRIVAANLRAAFLIGQAAAIQMQASGGSIVNLVSVAAIRGFPSRGAYCAAKAGILNLTQTMAVELASCSIRVNALAPGAIDIEQTRRQHGEQLRRAWHRAIPQSRYGDPGHVAAAASYLASDRAAFTTGHLLVVDGGFSAAGFTRQALSDGMLHEEVV